MRKKIKIHTYKRSWLIRVYTLSHRNMLNKSSGTLPIINTCCLQGKLRWCKMTSHGVNKIIITNYPLGDLKYSHQSLSSLGSCTSAHLQLTDRTYWNDTVIGLYENTTDVLFIGWWHWWARTSCDLISSPSLTSGEKGWSMHSLAYIHLLRPLHPSIRLILQSFTLIPLTYINQSPVYEHLNVSQCQRPLYLSCNYDFNH